MAMAPEIQEYYHYLLGDTEVMPGPIRLPDGFSPDALAKLIFHTLVKKAALLKDVRHVQILYSAWAILNDAYSPVTTRSVSAQTADPTACDAGVQTPSAAPRADAEAQTLAAADVTEAAAQTEPTGAPPPTVQADTQTEAVKRRTKWTQMRRRPLSETSCQAGCTVSALVESEAQTMLTRGHTVATQTHRRKHVTWALCEVEGAPSPPPVKSAFLEGVEDKTTPRRFHGRKLLRRPKTVPPPIPLQVEPTVAQADAGVDLAPAEVEDGAGGAPVVEAAAPSDGLRADPTGRKAGGDLEPAQQAGGRPGDPRRTHTVDTGVSEKTDAPVRPDVRPGDRKPLDTCSLGPGVSDASSRGAESPWSCRDPVSCSMGVEEVGRLLFGDDEPPSDGHGWNSTADEFELSRGRDSDDASPGCDGGQADGQRRSPPAEPRDASASCSAESSALSLISL